ncbi:lectin-like domain-containing protein [Tenacibaculum sp. C7A-26P2]|uniref:lectin-like domain-containing protein n=1 Tax=Tenacibaculum sp. C7A-26P2 TaxID=3447504 RepID=UPI003F87EB7E
MKRLILTLTLMLYSLLFYSQEHELAGKEMTAKELAILKANAALSDVDFTKRFPLIGDGKPIRGDMTFIANNNINLHRTNPHNGNASNGRSNLVYVDIDNDPNTFSSSAATLNVPSCATIVYAGLYWAGIYPYDTWENEGAPSPDFNKIKIKLPGNSSYQQIEAGILDPNEIIFNNGSATSRPYVCYKDITNIINKNSPNGEYIVADVRGTIGRDRERGLGGAAGWNIVIIYKNERDTSKEFFTFDGFSSISSGNNRTVNISGFRTVPFGPVNAKVLVATLEGDKSITGDQFMIQQRNTASFSTIFSSNNNNNPSNNFFNSSITNITGAGSHQHVTNRRPNSRNTLGYDADIFKLDNDTKSILTNNQTSTNLRFSSTGDIYWPFLVGMSIEVIEPKIRILKTVEDAAGNDMAGQTIGLGEELYYKLTFENIGTDNAINTVISDILPANADLVIDPSTNQPSDLSVPLGVTHTYTPASGTTGGTITFRNLDHLVRKQSGRSEIRFRVKLVETCNDLRDACSDVIENQAFASYSFDEGGGDRVINESSIFGLDPCDSGITGPTNFLADISGCTFEHEAVVCDGRTVKLVAASGFQSYEWRNESNVVVGNSQSLTVRSSDVGVYTVTTTAKPGTGCIEKTEIFNVKLIGAASNPIESSFDNYLNSCTSNNLKLGEIYLCGDGSFRTLNTGVDTSDGLTTIQWKKMVEGSCPDVTNNCANPNNACNWNDVPGSSNQSSIDVSEEGKYKLKINYNGECTSIYYFNVYKSTLSPNISKKHIICDTNGEITVNNIPNGYEYKLEGPGGAIFPYQGTGTFTSIATPGDYTLKIRRISSSAAASCEYTFPGINIRKEVLEVTVSKQDILCHGGTSQVSIGVNNNVPGRYTYQLLQGTDVKAEKSFNDNRPVTLDVPGAGTYQVSVKTPQCDYIEEITVSEPDELTLLATKTKDITCLNGSSNGIIELQANGGITTGVYSYALWKKQGVDLYTSISDILPSDLLTSTTYTIPNGEEGEYVFVVIDSNNCFAFSSPINVSLEAPITFTPSIKDISCSGQADGQIIINTNDKKGYTLDYNIDNGSGPGSWNIDNKFINLAPGTYTVNIRATRDTFQCFYQLTDLVISNKTAPSVNASVTQNIDCVTSGGQITFTGATGGTSPYTYIVGTEQSTTKTVFDNLTHGDYIVKIRDNNGCESTPQTLTIDPLPIIPEFTYDVTYNCDGTGNVTLNAPAIPVLIYTYTDQSIGTVNPTGNVFQNLAVGSHNIIVKTDRACDKIVTVNVAPGNQFGGNFVDSSNNFCLTGGSGKIQITAENYQGGDYEYSVNDGVSWDVATTSPFEIVGLPAGNYDVKIKDQGCIIDLADVTIEDFPELDVQATLTPATCDSGAIITAEGSGGIPPYEYRIIGVNGDAWQTSPTFTNIPPGTTSTDYTVEVKDSRDCSECIFDTAVTGCTDPKIDSSTSLNDLFVFDFDTVIDDQFTATLTPALNMQRGNLMSKNKISFSESFKLDFQVNLGSKKGNGADGITFVFHNDPRGSAAVGDSGGGLGASGIQNGIALEVDTWNNGPPKNDIADDHGAIFDTDNDAALTSPIGFSELEDDNWHSVQITWNVITNTLSYTIDGANAGSHTNSDFINTYFGGSDAIYFGFTSATGAANNRHRIRFNDFCKQIPYCPIRCQEVCSETDSTVVTVNAPIVVTHTATPVDCYDGSNGEIVVNVDQGLKDYMFRIDGGPWIEPVPKDASTHTFTGLSPATYSIEVKDGAGCISVASSHTINQQLSASEAIKNVTCTPGSVTINATGGDGSYEFAIIETGSGATPVYGAVNPLPITTSGSYDYFVKDGLGCVFTKTVNVQLVATLNVTTNITQPSCIGDNGSIEVVIAGGLAPYTINFDGTNLASGVTLQSGLAPGDYPILVTDANGCTFGPFTETINTLTRVASTASKTTDFTCNTDGVITFTAATGGTPPYTYGFNGVYSDDLVYDNLTDGTYVLTVKDDKGCTEAVDTIVIDPLPIIPEFTYDVTYNCDGTGNVTLNAPAAPVLIYTYTDQSIGTVNPTGNVFQNLAVGTHNIIVKTDRACDRIVAVTVEADKEFKGQISNSENPSCNGGSDGEIIITASNFNGSYQYNVNSTGWNTTSTAQTTISGLTAGAYNIQIRPDASSLAVCTIDLLPVPTLVEPTALLAPTVNVIKDVTCSNPTDASIRLTDAAGTSGTTPNLGGTPPYKYSIDGGASFPFPVSENVFDLPPGNYTFVVEDANGCTSPPTVHTIDPAENIVFTAVPTNCYDGTNGEIVINVTGGNGEYQFILNGASPQTPSPISSGTYTFSGLSPATYTVDVVDKAGCTGIQKTVTIHKQVTASYTIEDVTCNDGNITVNGQGGDSSYQYAIVGVGSGATPSFGTTNIFPITSPGDYEYFVRDGSLCEYSEVVTVNQVPNPTFTLALPNAEHECNKETESINVAISDGKGPYTITITDGGTYNNNVVTENLNHSFHSLPAGNYEVNVTDANLCSPGSQFIEIFELPELTATISGRLPSTCVNFIDDSSQYGFEYDLSGTTLPVAPYILQLRRLDGTWTADHTENIFLNIPPGTSVDPAMRIVNASGDVICLEFLERFETPFIVDGLIINPIANPSDCSTGFSVTVEAVGGVGPFEFAIDDITVWVGPDTSSPPPLPPAPVPSQDRTFTFTNLVPGRTYDFYVKDTNENAGGAIPGDPSDDCIKLNDEKLEFKSSVPITPVVDSNQCNTATSSSATGEITFNIDTSDPNVTSPFTWTLFKRDALSVGIPVAAFVNVLHNYTGNATSVVATGLDEGEYYIDITSGASGVCSWSSEDTLIKKGEPITGNVNVGNDISCGQSGVINITNVRGGFPGYTFQLNVTNATGITTPTSLTSIEIPYANVTNVALPVGVEVTAVDSNGCSDIIGNVILNVSQLPVINSVNLNSCGVNNSITIEMASGLAPYQYSTDNGVTYTPSSSDSPYIIAGVAEGNYDIVVRDANGCESVSQPLTIHPDIDFNLSVSQNLNCVPGEAVIDIEVLSGGPSNFTYTIAGISGGAVTPATNAGNIIGVSSTVSHTVNAEGVYRIEVTDMASGCVDSKEVTVAPVINPDFIVEATQNNKCDGSNAGEIRITESTNASSPSDYTIFVVSGGPYSGTIDTSDLTFKNLPEGQYTITGTSTVNGCSTTSPIIEIKELDPIEVVTSINDAFPVTEFGCTSGNIMNQAVITAIPSELKGGSGIYNYNFVYTPNSGTQETLDLPNGTTPLQFTTMNVSGGPVVITVTDSEGCTGVFNTQILPFNEISNVRADIDKLIDCNTGDNITILYDVTPSGATPNVEFSVTGINGTSFAKLTQSTPSFTNLPTGTYEIEVHNTNTGCKAVGVHQVNPAPVFTLSLNPLSNVSCKGDTDGSFEFAFSATPPYTGNYDYRVFNTNGTTVTTDDTQVGSLTTGVSGSSTVTGLGAGTYYVIVVQNPDSPFCTITSNTIEIEESDIALTLSAVQTPVKCHNGNDGKIVAEAFNGWGGYRFKLDPLTGTSPAVPYSGSDTFNNLAFGDYRVTVIDANGCEQFQDVTVGNPALVEFTLTKDDNSCDLTTGGSITVIPTGGSGDYIFELVDPSTGETIRTEEGTGSGVPFTFPDLAPNTYEVNVRDTNNCSAASQPAQTLFNNLEFNVLPTKDIDCSTSSPDGEVTVTISSGSGSYEYEVKTSAGGDLVPRIGTGGNTVTFNVPSTDTYTVRVFDTGATPNCSREQDITIHPKKDAQFTLAASVNNICNGTALGEITINEVNNGINPLTYTISPDPNGIGATNEKVFVNLPAGIYTITGVGTNNCSHNDVIEIEENNLIELSSAATVTPFGCTSGNETNLATVTVDPALITGGTNVYSSYSFIYTANNGTVQQLLNSATPSFNAVDQSGGTVQIIVYDSNNCEGTASVVIPEFNAISNPTVAVDKPIYCTTGEEITISFTSVSSVANVEYSVEGVNGTIFPKVTQTSGTTTNPEKFIGLGTGEYTIEVYNPDTGCKITTSYRVGNPPVYTIGISKKNSVTCLGSPTGSFDFDLNSSIPYTLSYDYNIVNANTGLTTGITGSALGSAGAITVNGLLAGVYRVVITQTDAPFCQITSDDITIEQPATALKLNMKPNLISCVSPTSGQVELDASGGWGSYDYQLVNVSAGNTIVQSFDKNNIINGLAAGEYEASVRDSNGCIESDTFILLDPTPITAIPVVTTNLCNGEETAIITVTNTTGGQGAPPSYRYTLTMPNGITTDRQETNVFTGLREGVYQITVHDEYSCSSSPIPVTITDPSMVVATANLKELITCDRNQAVIEVSGSGGTGGYTFSTDGVNFVAGNTFNVDPGTHNFYVKDANQCISPRPDIVTVADYVDLEARINVDSGFVTCNGDENGALSADVSGGLQTYEFELLDGGGTVVQPRQNSNLFSDLGVGTYKIKVYSSNPNGDVCTAETATVEIEQPDPLMVSESHTDVGCNGGNDGSITVNAIGGNGDYEYNIIGMSPNNPSSFPNNKFVKDRVFNDLYPDTYTITIKDKVGCYEVLEVIIGEPTDLNIISTNVNNQVCISDPGPSFTMNVTGGALAGTTASYILTLNGRPISGTFSEGIITLDASHGVESGNRYVVSILPVGSTCEPKEVPFETEEAIELLLDYKLSYNCPTGNTLDVGVQDKYKDVVVYSLYDGGGLIDTNDTGLFSNLPAGNNYKVEAEHISKGCPVSKDVEEIREFKALELFVDDSEKNKLIASGNFGLPPYEYSFDGGSFSPDNEMLILETRDYKVIVRDDRGCEEEVIIEGVYITIEVPNIFTPDGDGVNDTWYPINVEDYHDVKVHIYDRYSRGITKYEGPGGSHKHRSGRIATLQGSHEGWDGTYEGVALPSGDYWYTIYFKELSGQERQIMGHFTLYR